MQKKNRKEYLIEACKRYNIEILTHIHDVDDSYIIKIIMMQYDALESLKKEIEKES